MQSTSEPSGSNTKPIDSESAAASFGWLTKRSCRDSKRLSSGPDRAFWENSPYVSIAGLDGFYSYVKQNLLPKFKGACQQGF